MDNKPEWFDEEVAVTHPILEKGKQWIRDRPPIVQDAMRKFPPSCILRLKAPVCHLEAGQYVKLERYYETGTPDQGFWIELGVVDHPVLATEVHRCRMEQVEVMGYYNGLTPEVVNQILGDS